MKQNQYTYVVYIGCRHLSHDISVSKMAFLVLLRIFGLDFAIQWIFWSISAYFHTEWFFDLVGNLNTSGLDKR